MKKLYYKKNGGLTSASKNLLKRENELGVKTRFNNPILQREINQKIELIPLSDILASSARKFGHKKEPRKQNWETPISSKRTYIDEEYFKYKGHFSGYTGSNYIINVKSICRFNKDILTAIVHNFDTNKDDIITIKTGIGYHFDVDENGIKLVKTSNNEDLHIDTNHIYSGFKSIRSELLKLAEKRKQNRIKAKKAARKEKRKQSEIKKILKKYGSAYVSMSDSLKAGNCEVGTKQFASRHNLNINKHYKIDSLPEQSTRKVQLVILQAIKRHISECKKGYCTT